MSADRESQLASTVLMIRPCRFESNPLTALSNRFQGKSAATADEQQHLAEQEFAALQRLLTENGLRVIAVDDTPEPHTPDAIFPNNWISFHADGTVVLYPMEAANRRTERRHDVVDTLADRHGFQVHTIVDLTHHELEGHYLEGTGSMVLDRTNRIAYACLSSRTHLHALGEFAQRLDYEVLAFDAIDRDGRQIYHTNVMMNVGESMSVLCAQSIARAEQRQAVMQSLAASGHETIELSFDQMEAFAGNMLELRADSGENILVMSAQARRSLTASQIADIERHARIVSSPIDNIEASAGGSVRCMLAEVHLPR